MLKSKFILSSALDLVKREWEELSLKEGDCVTETTERVCHLCSKWDLHQAMPAEMLANIYGYKIEQGNQGVYKDVVRYIGMRFRTPNLKKRMEHLAALDTSLNKSQHGSGPNTTTTMKASASNMHSK